MVTLKVQLSVATGVPKVTPDAVHKLLSVLTITSDGAEIVGFWLSVTVTSCVAVAEFPAASKTVHVTVVVPNGKVAGAL